MLTEMRALGLALVSAAAAEAGMLALLILNPAPQGPSSSSALSFVRTGLIFGFVPAVAVSIAVLALGGRMMRWLVPVATLSAFLGGIASFAASRYILIIGLFVYAPLLTYVGMALTASMRRPFSAAGFAAHAALSLMLIIPPTIVGLDWFLEPQRGAEPGRSGGAFLLITMAVALGVLLLVPSLTRLLGKGHAEGSAA